MAFILWPGIMMSVVPSPVFYWSLIIIAPSCPNDICRRLPILKIVFCNSLVFI